MEFYISCSSHVRHCNSKNFDLPLEPFRIKLERNEKMFHSFLGPSYSWFAWNLVHQLLRSRDPCSPALRPVHASIRSLLPTGRHGVKWKVSKIKLTRKNKKIHVYTTLQSMMDAKLC